MIAKKHLYTVLCDQRFFATEDIGIYLVAKVGYLVVPKGELPISVGFHQKGFSYIDEHDHDRVCATCPS